MLSEKGNEATKLAWLRSIYRKGCKNGETAVIPKHKNGSLLSTEALGTLAAIWQNPKVIGRGFCRGSQVPPVCKGEVPQQQPWPKRHPKASKNICCLDIPELAQSSIEI